MKNILWLLVVVSSFSLAQDSVQDYPMGPIAKLTPGELCDRPTRYRYPENIAYCERNVVLEQKEQVFLAYKKSGYRMGQNRSSFKIDHYFPLCAGGSNNNENLWPQHLSISAITDTIEQLGCEKMASGKISQARFLMMVKRVKNDLRQANAVKMELSRL